MINKMEDLLPFLVAKRRDILRHHYPTEQEYLDGYLAALEDIEKLINEMDQAFIDAISEELNNE